MAAAVSARRATPRHARSPRVPEHLRPRRRQRVRVGRARRRLFTVEAAAQWSGPAAHRVGALRRSARYRPAQGRPSCHQHGRARELTAGDGRSYGRRQGDADTRRDEHVAGGIARRSHDRVRLQSRRADRCLANERRWDRAEAAGPSSASVVAVGHAGWTVRRVRLARRRRAGDVARADQRRSADADRRGHRSSGGVT